jgi:hypothetical protein
MKDSATGRMAETASGHCYTGHLALDAVARGQRFVEVFE